MLHLLKKQLLVWNTYGNSNYVTDSHSHLTSVSLFLFLAPLRWGIQSARVSVYLSTTGPELFPINPKALGSSTLRRHSLLAGRAAPRARLLSWWNQWEIYSQFQQLQDQPSSTMQQRQQRIQSNAHQRGCANICNRSKTCLRRWILSFFFFFLLLSFFFLMNATGSFSVTRFSPSGGKRFICFERILRSNLATKGKICKKSISTTLVVHINKGILK